MHLLLPKVLNVLPNFISTAAAIELLELPKTEFVCMHLDVIMVMWEQETIP